MTGYGEIAAERLITAAASEGITVVSGFMYGIDAAAHSAALDAEGITAAVMPCGIERIHPLVQEKLYYRILENRGLIISEFEGDMQPARWSFPRRNRIIAGLSPALLVIEAGLKSGALITADYAHRYSRDIFAVPGPITSSVSIGTANLIKQGASLVSSAEDILNYYGKFYLTADSESSSENHKGKTNCIMELLKKEALSMDEIIRKSAESASETGAEITRLLIRKKLFSKRDYIIRHLTKIHINRFSFSILKDASI